MAHLWIPQTDGWAILPLERASLPLAEVQRAAFADSRGAERVALCRTDPGREEWHLVTAPGTRVAVNGLPVFAGLRTLLDRDEIRTTGLGRVYFSTERLARVESLPEQSREVSCPRCRQRIEAGALAVRCPGCNLWHHQSEDLPCWTYAATCAMCEQATAEHTGFRWTPEEC